MAYGNTNQTRTKQRKEKRNRTERKGRAFRHGLFSFHFQLSSFTPTLILPGLVLFSCSGRNQQTNETACVLFSFFPAVRNCLLALMKHGSFYWVVIRGREGSTATAGLFFVHSQAFLFWGRETGMNVFRLTIDMYSFQGQRGKRQCKACTGEGKAKVRT